MLDPKIEAEVKAQHPEAVFLTAKGSGETVAVVSPNRVKWKAFRKMMAKEDTRADALEQFLRNCAVWPDAAGITAMLERKPALAEVFGEELVGLAGGAEEVEKNG
jgi:hypothetical protein